MTKEEKWNRQVKHNQSLWKFYPIGTVASVFNVLDGLRVYLDAEELTALDGVAEALGRFDTIIRRKRHPLPKRTR